MINRLIIAVALILCSLNASAQRLEAYKNKLAAPDSVHLSRIEIVEHTDAAAALRTMPRPSEDEKIKGYRVRIFYDNSQRARSLAHGAEARFKEFFPGIPIYTTYESPNFKVSVGNCITAEEAITLWGRVKNSFDMAIVSREEIQIMTLKE